MSKYLLVLCVGIIVLPSVLFAWGGTGHKLINRNAVIHLPSSMQQLIDQKSYLEAHASDADNRKSSDPTESPKHFIDIDTYPNFQNKVLSYDSLTAKYGASFVVGEGTLPWATKTTVDSLTAQFKRGDWTKAYQTAADLGHYVGDGHQPLHLTSNYDGGSTGNNGIHSRYETKMLDTYQSSITVTRDSVRYIADPLTYIFRYIDFVNTYVDTIMKADTEAKTAAGGSTSGTVYLAALWAKTGSLTNLVIQQATVDLASFYYTAWVDAGLVARTTDVAAGAHGGNVPAAYSLSPNYPNPFNPSTNIRFTVGSTQVVSIDVYDVLGRRVAALVHETLSSGSYVVQWNAAGVPSGVYYCRLQAGGYSAVQKMIYQK